MSSPKKFFINTVATYARSVLSAGLALFSSRWVLTALGASDYGLFNVVGAIIVFITFLNGVMASSAARHLAFSIGRGETEEANKWFNTALAIHLLLPTVLIVIGLPIGEYCVREVLSIPPERIGACIWVFRISLFIAFMNMLAIPYVAMFNAKQHLSEIAAWGMSLSVYNFLLAYALAKTHREMWNYEFVWESWELR
jgi:Na+-driven multidrug efflux pump